MLIFINKDSLLFFFLKELIREQIVVEFVDDLRLLEKRSELKKIRSIKDSRNYYRYIIYDFSLK